MSKLIEMFLVFFTIGLFTIGGGYAMIPMIETEVINRGWLTIAELQNFLAISESTPGAFAINIATFIGYTNSGILGGIITTLGVILPSVIIILIITKCADKFLKNKVVKEVLEVVKAVVVGLIAFVAIKQILMGIFEYDLAEVVKGNFAIDIVGIVIMASVYLLMTFKKKVHPILLIVLAAILGMIFY